MPKGHFTVPLAIKMYLVDSADLSYCGRLCWMTIDSELLIDKLLACEDECVQLSYPDHTTTRFSIFDR